MSVYSNITLEESKFFLSIKCYLFMMILIEDVNLYVTSEISENYKGGLLKLKF